MKTIVFIALIILLTNAKCPFGYKPSDVVSLEEQSKLCKPEEIVVN